MLNISKTAYKLGVRSKKWAEDALVALQTEHLAAQS